MQFQDDVAAGTVLVRPALQSPDYVAGASGWSVKIDGSAEFNDITIRGATSVGGKALYYNGTPAAGNLLLSISAASGTDTYGNNYPTGLGVFGSDGSVNANGASLAIKGNDGSDVTISTGGVGNAVIYLTPQSLTGITWDAANLYTVLGSSNRPGVGLRSPANPANGAALGSIEIYGSGPTTTDTYVLFGADRVSVNNALEVYGDITTYSKWTTFTPVLNNVGTATFSSVLGWYKRIGDVWLFEVYAVASAAGSGTTAVTVSGLPFNPYRAGNGPATTRQRVTAHLTAVSAGTNSSVSGTFSGLCFAGGATSTIDRLTGPTAIDLRGENISSSFIMTMQGWMRAA